jgi:hypothetical protein
LEQTTLSLEKEKILAYIAKYGNTRVGDLVNYGKFKLKLPEEQIKTSLNNMVLYEELASVVHEELELPIYYLRWGDVPHVEGMQAYSLFLSARRLNDKEISYIKAIMADTEKKADKRRLNLLRCPLPKDNKKKLNISRIIKKNRSIKKRGFA